MAHSDSFQLVLNELTKDLKDINDALALIGLYHLGKIAIKALYNTYICAKTYLLPRIFSNEKWLKSLGSWAVVTGSSSGIGLAYAKELAKRRFNLILIAKEADLLDKIANHFVSNFKIQVIKVACDLSDSEAYAQIEKVIIARDIGVLGSYL